MAKPQLQDIVNQLRAQVAALQTQIDTVNAALDAAEQQHIADTATIKERDALIADLRAQVVVFQRRIAELEAQVPPPAPPPPSPVLYSTEFDTKPSWLGLWGNTPTPAPVVVNGRLEKTWVGGIDNNGGGEIYLPAGMKKVHVRFRWGLPLNANLSGIMKLVRFRGTDGKAIGTFHTYGDRHNFWGDDFMDNANHFFDGVTPPSAAKGSSVWVEVMLDWSAPTGVTAKMWLNGRLGLDYTRPGVIYPLDISRVYLWSYFNTPADSRTEWIDSLAVDNKYIGVPA